MKNISKFSLFTDDAQTLSVLLVTLIVFFNYFQLFNAYCGCLLSNSSFTAIFPYVYIVYVFDSKLIVLHNTTTKSPNLFNLSVATLHAYVMKSKKTVILLTSKGTNIMGNPSSFACKTFVRSYLSIFLILSFVRYNDAGESSYFSSFRISQILKWRA